MEKYEELFSLIPLHLEAVRLFFSLIFFLATLDQLKSHSWEINFLTAVLCVDKKRGTEPEVPRRNKTCQCRKVCVFDRRAGCPLVTQRGQVIHSEIVGSPSRCTGVSG